MPHFIVGVDLGAHSIKAVVLQTGFRQLRVMDAYERVVAPGEAPYAERAGGVLRDLLVEQSLTDATLYAVLPGDRVSVRLLTLPFSDARKLDSVIPFELESQIVKPIGEVLCDHAIVDHPPQGGARVLAAAAGRDDISTYLEICAGAGAFARSLFAAPLVYGALSERMLEARVEPGMVEPLPPEALSEPTRPGMPQAGRAEISAIIDIGAERTNVCVLKRGRVLLGRTISRGGLHVTRAMAKSLAMTEEVAERLKIERGSLAAATTATETRLREAIALSLVPLVRELRQTFALLSAEFRVSPQVIHLAGGGARLHGLADHLAHELQADVRPLDLSPLRGIWVDGGPSPELEPVLPLALAVALAGATGRREIDFRRGEFAYKADFSFLRVKARYLAACLCAVLLAAGINGFAARRQLRQEEAALTKMLETETVELFGEAQTDPELVDKRIKQGIKMDELPVPIATAYDLLDDISKYAPIGDRKLDVTELEIRNKKTVIKGTADSTTTIDEIVQGLAKIPCFSGEKGDAIQKGQITNVPGQQGQKQFTLTIASKCP